MFEYKDYQKRIFKNIDKILETIKKYGDEPNMAWERYFFIMRPEDTGIKESPRYRPFTNKPLVPYFCLRVPTGGGKTILACETVGKTKIDFFCEKTGIVLWFVPTEAIYEQTLQKLKNLHDPHRQVLNKYFDNKVTVFSKDEALSRLKPHMLDDGLTIIVSIIDSFSMGEKVYKGSNDGYESFSKRLNEKSDLLISETLDNKGNKSSVENDSLFNIIRTYNPIIIIDEGHRYGSDLRQATIADLNPSFIWEYTATPDIANANIFHRTSPIELKIEQMIKMPIQIHHQPTWEDVITKAIELQNELEKSSKAEKKKTGRYIRPIVLIRPNQIKEEENELTPSTIKKYIEKNHPEIILDGEKRMLAERYSEGKSNKKGSKKVDTLGEVHKLFDEGSNIRYIIAYNAIREGWDCSFAYVYANLSNIRSRTDAEQFIGRIMRMPEAKETTIEKLNKCYVVTMADNNKPSELEESVDNIINILTDSGYSNEEAIKAIQTGENEKINLPYISNRQIKTKQIKLPKLITNIDGDEEELLLLKHLWKGFDIRDIKLSVEQNIILEVCGIVEIDIDEKEKSGWSKSGIVAEDAHGLFEYDINILSADLAKSCKDKNISPKEQYKVLLDWLKELIKKYDIKDLRRNSNLLKQYFKEVRNKTRLEIAKSNFNKSYDSGKLFVSNNFQYFLPEEQINLFYPNGKFSKSLYDEIDNVNKEEKDFASSFFENNKNIKWFYRNRENKDFYIQGYWGKFYPDFIFETVDGKLGVSEYKGREDKLDTEKKELGIKWSKISGLIFDWNGDKIKLLS
ncbi:MAG TPA: DEAD/DEAH box helicase family protein [Ignavibacteria bacterium]